MSQEAKRPNEFRRTRQALTAAYLCVAAGVALLLASSVVKELFFRRPGTATASAAAADHLAVSELLECHRMVLDLVTVLGDQTSELLASPMAAQGDRGELASRWEAVSRAWRDAWDVAEARCRFSELADIDTGNNTGAVGIPYDRLARVHGDLPSMRLKYQALLVRFDEDQADELARMRRDLDLSRRELEELAGADPTPTPAAPAR